MTAEELLDWYYKTEKEYDEEILGYVKEQGLAYKDELKGLKEIMEDPEATDEIEIKGGKKINVNLHKKDVDVQGSILKYISKSEHMNNLLNKKDDLYLSPDTIRDIENTSSALKQLKPYKGTVYRYDHRQELPKVGEIITIPSFYSTSSEKDELDMVPYYTTRKTFYEIESKNGKELPIKSLSYTNENEVLFDLGTKFEVIKAEKRGTKNYIKMREK